MGPNRTTSISPKFDQQKAPLELVPNFDHQIALLALVANFSTRWHYFGSKFDHQVDLMSYMHCHIALDCPIGSISLYSQFSNNFSVQ